MTEPLSTVCDHCGAKLKLKNPDLEGKKIKCPKCGEAFVAVSADSKPTPKKLAKRKTVSDDDDLNFLDVDPDDYGSSRADDDDFDDDDAPRERRTRPARGKKKSGKKKSKGGSDSGQVVKILAIVAVLVLLVGGGGFALMSLPKGNGADELDWLPSDIQGFVKVEVDDIWAALVIQKLKSGPEGQKFVEQMTKNVGVGPQDVDQMVVGLPPNGQSISGTTLIRAKKPIDSEAIKTADPAAKQVSHLGSTYLKMGDNSVIFQPDPKTLVRGPESTIKTLIERGKKNPSESKFAFAKNNRDHLVMAMIEPSAASGNTLSNSPFSFTGGQNSESVLIRANASSDIRLTLQGAFKTADSAKVNADKLKADLEKGKAELAKSKSLLQNAPPNPLVKADQVMKLMNGAEQVMNSIQVSQSGSGLNIQMSVSGQVINDFIETASSMGGNGPPMGFPMPFGSK